jgi:hypothetical protein
MLVEFMLKMSVNLKVSSWIGSANVRLLVVRSYLIVTANHITLIYINITSRIFDSGVDATGSCIILQASELRSPMF